MKTQISTSVGSRTREQAEHLVERFGTMTAVLTVAIDRLYRAEIAERSAQMAPRYIDAYNTLAAVMDYDRFEHIVDLAGVPAADVAEFIDGGKGGWDENPASHQSWLDGASDQEIADWVVAGL
jgi:hypothetical protein